MSYRLQSEHPMNNRPRSVAFVGWLFVATGIFGFAYHFTELKVQEPFEYELVWVLFVRLLAIVGGVFMLRGANWARWFLLAWIAYHVILSALHSVSELVIHSFVFAGVAYVLLRPVASTYFQRGR